MLTNYKSILNRYSAKKYFWLLLEKALKIVVSFLVIFLLKEKGEYQIISLFALIELSSFIINTVSIFGTDLVAQREFTNSKKLNKTFNIFFTTRCFSSIIIFIISLISFSFFVDHPLNWTDKFIMSFFILLSPFQTVEYFMYGRSNFDLVYKLKFYALLVVGVLKIIASLYYPQYVIYSISLDFILIYILYMYFLVKEDLKIKIRWFYLRYFFKNYFLKTGYLFVAAIIVTMTNHYLFYSAKNSLDDYEVSNLYIFLKVAEGLNFLSLNIAIMKIPKLSHTSFNFNTEFLSIFNKKNYKYSILAVFCLLILFSILFYIYQIDYYVICLIMSIILFLVNSLQIFMGVNFVFQKKELHKLIMNFGSIFFLVLLTFYTTKSNFISYIIVLIIAKLLITILMQHKFFRNI